MNSTHILVRHSTPISCLDLWYSTRDHYLRLGSYREQKGLTLVQFFGAGWVQKGVGGIFLKIRPHSCV